MTMDRPVRVRDTGRGAFVAGIVLALLGALVVAVWGVLAVFSSDACSPDSTAYYCSGGGQNLGVWIGVGGGPGAFVVLAIAGAASRRLRRAWPWWCVGVEAVAFLTIATLSSKVS